MNLILNMILIGHVPNTVSQCQVKKCNGLGTKTCQFDFEVKGQGRIGIMNVRGTSYHGDRRMCQIW